MGPRFINGTGARASQRQRASGGRGRDREQGAATGARAGPGGRPHAGQRGQRDARESQGTNPACQSPGATVPGAVAHGCWRPGTRARRPTDLLTDRRRHAPLHPAPPRPAPPPQLALCLYLLHFFSASASFGLPWRQSLPLAQAGAWTVCRALCGVWGQISL